MPDCKKRAKAPKAEGTSQKQVGKGGGQGEGQGQNQGQNPVSARTTGTADPSQVKDQGVPYLNPDPFQQWIGPKNLSEAVINGELTTCLLDNGAQLNFITPAYARWQNMNVFPLECLAEEVGDAIPPIQGIGGIMMQPTGFVIVRLPVARVMHDDVANKPISLNSVDEVVKVSKKFQEPPFGHKVIHGHTRLVLTGCRLNIMTHGLETRSP